jgi:peptidoglycan/xylan/chitin deacetylase (PgdA/CDA1 family)
VYRSKLADERNLIAKLNIAAIIVLVILAGSVVAMGLHRNANEIETVFIETETTYEIFFEPEPEEIIFVEENIFEEEIFFEEEIILENEFYFLEQAERIFSDGSEECRAPIIALTFDDGPAWLTEVLLDILDEHEVRVTFCVIGNRIENHAEIILRAFESGHEIIGHSWEHKDLARLSVNQIKEQITKTSDAIEKIIGEEPPRFFRAPFGSFNSRIRNAAKETGYGVLNWSIDPRDWQFRDEEMIFDYIIENARDGAIVVLHDVHQTTVDAMKRVVPALIYMGYELVTASEVVEYVYGEAEAGFEFTGTRK